MAVHLNIPLRLPLRNAIRQSIHRRSIAASTPLPPAKATEGVGAVLLLRSQCCTVVAAVASLERFRTITTISAAVLLRRTPIGTVARCYYRCVAAGTRNITAGAAAVTAGWKLEDISSGVMTRFRPPKTEEKGPPKYPSSSGPPSSAVKATPSPPLPTCCIARW